jgi:Tfp pilus assembly protein PilF
VPLCLVNRLLCCVVLCVALFGCDNAAAPAAPDDAPEPPSAAEYTPPPDPGPDARAAFERGKALMAKGDLDEAINQLGRAVTIEPRFAQAYLHRAMARQRQGAAALAMVDADNALLHDPRLADAYRVRAELYERRFYLDNDPADKQRADDDRERHERLIGEQTADDFGGEVDEAIQRALQRDE